MTLSFTRATKTQAHARIALIGPSGSGKTMTSLKIATTLGGKIALIDTEHGSASKYADRFAFDVLDLESFSPLKYIEAIRAAEAAGYDVLIIDSLSHAWAGKEGALEQVDRIAKRSQTGNKFTAWADVTPMWNALLDAIIAARLHVIATMRAKMDYILETNDKGKQQPKKVGLGPICRDQSEYEFDIVADLDLDHRLIVSKTRCEALDGAVIEKPGLEFGQTVLAWLTDGAPMPVVTDSGTINPATGEITLRSTPTNGGTKAEPPAKPVDSNDFWTAAKAKGLNRDNGLVIVRAYTGPNGKTDWAGALRELESK